MSRPDVTRNLSDRRFQSCFLEKDRIKTPRPTFYCEYLPSFRVAMLTEPGVSERCIYKPTDRGFSEGLRNRLPALLRVRSQASAT